jgi:hypothetical protein
MWPTMEQARNANMAFFMGGWRRASREAPAADYRCRTMYPSRPNTIWWPSRLGSRSCGAAGPGCGMETSASAFTLGATGWPWRPREHIVTGVERRSLIPGSLDRHPSGTAVSAARPWFGRACKKAGLIMAPAASIAPLLAALWPERHTELCSARAPTSAAHWVAGRGRGGLVARRCAGGSLVSSMRRTSGCSTMGDGPPAGASAARPCLSCCS